MPIPPPNAGKAERRLLRTDAHDKIRDAILDGTLAPGESLDDAQMRAWLGISRSPIRDALLALQMEGLVEVHPQSGTRVVQPEPEQVEQSIQAIGAIMGGVLRVTIPVFTDESRRVVLTAAEKAHASLGGRDVAAHFEATTELYEALLRYCPNAMMVSLARAVLVTFTFHYRSVIGQRTPNWELLESVWERVVRGLETGDSIMAELAFEEGHRLPLPGYEWDAAVWSRSGS